MKGNGSAEIEAAKEHLAALIVEVDRLIGERDGVERGPGEILTHWVVVAAWTDADDADGTSSQLTHISSGMPYWAMDGLLGIAREHLRNETVYGREDDDS